MSMLDTQETEPRIQPKHVENSSENGVSGSDPNSSDAESDPKTQTSQNALQSGIKPIPKARSSSEIQPSDTCRKQEFGRRHSAFGNEKQIPSELSRQGEEKITNISHDSENLLSKQTDKKYATSSKMRRKSGSDKQENISESGDTENGFRISSDRRHFYTVNDSSEEILALVDLGANRVHRDSTGNCISEEFYHRKMSDQRKPWLMLPYVLGWANIFKVTDKFLKNAITWFFGAEMVPFIYQYLCIIMYLLKISIYQFLSWKFLTMILVFRC